MSVNPQFNPNEITDLIKGKNPEQIRLSLQNWLAPEIADLVTYLPKDEQLKIFSALPTQEASTAFAFLPHPIQKETLENLPSDKAAAILNDLSPDDRTSFLEDLPSQVVNHLLKLLSPEERTLTLKLLGYPEHSVGRLMTPDYIAIKLNWTVQQVLDYVREHGKDSETINFLYVVDDQGHLIDDIRLKEFLFASPTDTVEKLSDNKFIALAADADEETAINIFRKYERSALPVIDKQGILLGIVTIDDILHLAQEEETEDIQKIGGTVALEEPYMQIPFLELMKKRISWLTILFLGEMLTATALGYFEHEISSAVVLALFLPLIISSGGNSGSQASTLIICAMTLGEVSIKDWWRIMHREIFSGLFLGTILGAIGFFRISLSTLFTSIYGEHWFLIALTIFFSLIGVVLWGTITGSMLPLILKKLKFDPATSSAPFVATIVDVTGLIIYFYIARIVLHGTLL